MLTSIIETSQTYSFWAGFPGVFLNLGTVSPSNSAPETNRAPASNHPLVCQFILESLCQNI